MTNNDDLPAPTEKGRLGICNLKRAWFIIRHSSTIDPALQQSEFHKTTMTFDVAGIGIPEATAFIYSHSASFDEFEDWVKNKGLRSEESIELFNAVVSGRYASSGIVEPNRETPTLTTDDLSHWNEFGYVIVRNAVPKDDCQILVEFIESSLNRADKATEHAATSDISQGIMLNIFQHSAMTRNRFAPRVQEAFQQLWGRNDLVVSNDRLGYNRPSNSSSQIGVTDIHWDVSLKQPIPFSTQGILYLADTAENQGAFAVVPGFHRTIGNWLESLPEGADPRKQDFEKLGLKRIAANQGDLIIWHQALPHGATPNKHHLPRYVQYINYRPFDLEVADEWI